MNASVFPTGGAGEAVPPTTAGIPRLRAESESGRGEEHQKKEQRWRTERKRYSPTDKKVIPVPENRRQAVPATAGTLIPLSGKYRARNKTEQKTRIYAKKSDISTENRKPPPADRREVQFGSNGADGAETGISRRQKRTVRVPDGRNVLSDGTQDFSAPQSQPKAEKKQPGEYFYVG